MSKNKPNRFPSRLEKETRPIIPEEAPDDRPSRRALKKPAGNWEQYSHNSLEDTAAFHAVSGPAISQNPDAPASSSSFSHPEEDGLSVPAAVAPPAAKPASSRPQPIPQPSRPSRPQTTTFSKEKTRPQLPNLTSEKRKAASEAESEAKPAGKEKVESKTEQKAEARPQKAPAPEVEAAASISPAQTPLLTDTPSAPKLSRKTRTQAHPVQGQELSNENQSLKENPKDTKEKSLKKKKKKNKNRENSQDKETSALHSPAASSSSERTKKAADHSLKRSEKENGTEKTVQLSRKEASGVDIVHHPETDSGSQSEKQGGSSRENPKGFLSIGPASAQRLRRWFGIGAILLFCLSLGLFSVRLFSSQSPGGNGPAPASSTAASTSQSPASSSEPPAPDSAAASSASGSETAPAALPAEKASFTFTGVGDNLLHDTIFVYHEQDHGNRDYAPLYEMTDLYTQNADLAYINFETVCAGDAFGLSGYPNFNGPIEMIDTLANAGFDWFSLSSNHSLDVGADGLRAEMQAIRERHPDISTSGTSSTIEEAETPVVRTVNGIRVGLASFTYGLNDHVRPEGEDWLIDVYRNDDGSINYPLIEKRIQALNAVSDVQFVSMHWGEEYQSTPTQEERDLAQYLSQLGVEVILGSHPHVIQPVELIQTPEQTTLVYYSLGNFISAQDRPEAMIGGMASFQLTYDFTTQSSSFQDIAFIPTITWISPDLRTYRTTTILEYNSDLASSHYLNTQGQTLSREWIADYVKSVLGNPENIEVVLFGEPAQIPADLRTSHTSRQP